MPIIMLLLRLHTTTHKVANGNLSKCCNSVSMDIVIRDKQLFLLDKVVKLICMLVLCVTLYSSGSGGGGGEFAGVATLYQLLYPPPPPPN